MRIGSNPTKENNKLDAKYYHRIIMPVYVPNLDGYFSRSLEILKMALDSLLHTIHDRTAITVIDNACCEEVRQLLGEYHAKGLIDQLIVNKDNNGKIDPLLSAARGTYEPLITITDNDVLFLPGWITEVEKSIEAFPEIGLVSPCPVPVMWHYYTSTVLLSNILRIKSGPLLRKEELMNFPISVGRLDMYNKRPNLLEKQNYLERKGVKVVVGAGHFVATLRREVFDYAPRVPSLKKIVGGSERNYIDVPVDRGCFFRVGTSRILAHHMGNIPEQWMLDEFEKIKNEDTPPAYFKDRVPSARRKWVLSWIPSKVRMKVTHILLKAKLHSIFGIRL
jgi:Glycosyl transferase family 2